MIKLDSAGQGVCVCVCVCGGGGGRTRQTFFDSTKYIRMNMQVGTDRVHLHIEYMY